MPRRREVSDAMMAEIANWWLVRQSVLTPKAKAAELGITPQHLLRLARRAYVHKRTKYDLTKLIKFVSRETFTDEQNKGDQCTPSRL